MIAGKLSLSRWEIPEEVEVRLCQWFCVFLLSLSLSISISLAFFLCLSLFASFFLIPLCVSFDARLYSLSSSCLNTLRKSPPTSATTPFSSTLYTAGAAPTRRQPAVIYLRAASIPSVNFNRPRPSLYHVRFVFVFVSFHSFLLVIL